MVATENHAIAVELSSLDLQISLIAVHILETLLADSSKPDIQYHVLSELLHAKQHFAVSFEVSAFLIAQARNNPPTTTIVNSLFEAYDASL